MVGFAIASRRLSNAQAQFQRSGQKSFLVVAPKRSGHHAVINWIANGLESKDVKWTGVQFPGDRWGLVAMRHSSDGVSVHLNQIPLKPHWRGSPVCLDHLSVIRESKYFIANLEDATVSSVEGGSWLIRHPSYKIVVWRSVLNLLASRLEKRKSSSKYFFVDEPLLDMLLDVSEPPEDWIVIRFDDWLLNPSGYRNQIMNKLGMRSDLAAEMSHFGGGSSFSGTTRTPTVEELTTRFRRVVWPTELVERLLDPKYRSLLTGVEIEFLESQGSDSPRSIWGE